MFGCDPFATHRRLSSNTSTPFSFRSLAEAMPKSLFHCPHFPTRQAILGHSSWLHSLIRHHARLVAASSPRFAWPYRQRRREPSSKTLPRCPVRLPSVVAFPSVPKTCSCPRLFVPAPAVHKWCQGVHSPCSGLRAQEPQWPAPPAKKPRLSHRAQNST
jgi:hypothetical protein